MDGLVIWLTGLPASGKTTLSKLLVGWLKERGYKAEMLDGDWVRSTINIEAGYTREEREKHLVRVAWIARLLARNGIIVVCSFVSPYVSVRQKIRRIVEEESRYFEVYVKCSLQKAMDRDPKGLYARAIRGEVKNVTGIDDPYEEPKEPDFTVDTEKLDVRSSWEALKSWADDLIKGFAVKDWRI